jgi:hypothetical protein
MANSIGAAHSAVSDVIEFVVRADGGPERWNVQLSLQRPGDDADNDDRLVRELPDESAAHYAYKELIRRGFSDAGFANPDDEWSEDVRFLVVSKRSH